MTKTSPNILLHTPNFNDRNHPIQYIILHYTEISFEDTVRKFMSPASQVSAHYIVHTDGHVLQMVPDAQRAWHAGVSYWKGCTDINSCSLGIELVNEGCVNGVWTPYPDTQIKALMALCRHLMQQHSIPPQSVLGHMEVALGRKVDPGPLFPWKRLACAGIGLWPKHATCLSINKLPEALARIGYACDNLAYVLRAIQMRYRPHNMNGMFDAETLTIVHFLSQL